MKDTKNCLVCSDSTSNPNEVCGTCVHLTAGLSVEDLVKHAEKIYTTQISKDLERRCVFVGRWQPFHKSHEALIRTKLDEGHPCLVLVRATPINEGNPYTLFQTLEMIRAAFEGENVKALPISDVSGIYYGRKVGYLVEEIDMPDEVKRISATKIRECLNTGDATWRDFVNPKVAKVLEKIHSTTEA